MKRKTFILSFLMMVCFGLFAQTPQPKWPFGEVDTYPFENYMSVVAKIVLDDDHETTDYLELGAFCNDELRGSKMFQASASDMILMSVWGDENTDEIIFKLYNHTTGMEYSSEPVAYSPAVEYGTPSSPVEINFSNPVAKIGETKYSTLTKAIAAATAGQTIELLADITENVTVSKNLTIDGANDEAVGGKFNYTGTMTANAGLTVTVQNIDFVGGGFDKSNKSTTGNYTIKNCTFEDDGDYAYAFRFKGASSVTIEDCTVKNYLYSFLYITSGTNKVSVKNVTVEDCPSYAVYFASGVNTATIENLTVKNSNNGFVINNTANRALTLINCKLENVLNAINHSNGTNTITCTLLGNENDFGTSVSSQYAKYVLAAADATLTAPEGATVTSGVEGYDVAYVGGVYKLVVNNVEIVETGVKYAKLAEAINAATAGQTIKLLADINENVTVNKSVTIDGANAEGGKFDYTGTMTANNGLTVTVQNIDFVGGGFDKSSKSSTGNYTIKNCTFEDDGNYPYPLKFRGANKIIVEDCTVKNYMYSFLYITSGTNIVSVKNVTVEDCSNYAVYFSSGVNTATIENLTVKNSDNGFVINNTANRALTLKNCKLENVGTAVAEANGTNTITCTLLGNENNFGTSATSQYAKYVLADVNATLTAPEGLNVISGVDNLEVIYKNGCYSLYGLSGSGAEEDPFLIYNLEDLKFFRDHVNAGKTRYNAENVYVALAANIDMASEDWSVNIGDDCIYTFDGIFDGNGFTISNLNSTETAQKADGYVCTGLFGAIYGNAVIKNLTIENVSINTAEYTGNNAAAVVGFVYDVNGKTTTIENVTVKGDVNINASGVYGVGAIVGYSYEGGAVNIKNCKVVANEGSVITATSGTGAIIGYCAGRTTIDGCTVDNIDITGKGLVGGIAGITSISNTKNLTNNTVKNVNLTATKAEWVNSTAIAVGTMSGDGLTVANTIFENVNASRMVGSVYAEQPTYVVPAVEARIENKYYGTFDAALAAAQEGSNTITVLAPVVITEDKTYDLTGLSVDGENVYPIFRIQNGANVVVANGNISNDDYVFVLGASDGSSAGNLTIESGVYTGTTTVASVTKGLLKINGGEFKVNASEYGATYMINCIDANYNDDLANVEIYGGKFYGFNPEDNAAEGANTNFCAQGYAANEIETGVYEVVAGMVLNQTKGIKYATLSAAIAAASANDVIVLLQNITENVTVNKSVTIDGGDKNYTGTMEGNAGLTITIQNVNFVNAGFAKNTKSTTGTYTFKNCTFDGAANTYAYPLKFRGANQIIVENCTVKDYLYSFLYVANSTNNVNVKNVTVENCPDYAVYFASGVGENHIIENLTVKNSDNGVIYNNTANRKLNLKNCKLENVGTAVADANGTNTITCTLLGNENDFGTSASSQYAKYVLAESTATLTAPEGLNVTTSVAGHIVDYADGKYYLRVPNYVAAIGETKYESLQAAIDAAVDGDEVVVLENIDLSQNELGKLDGSYDTYFKVEGKTVTIDLNGKTISGAYTGTGMLVGVFSTENNGHLTLKDTVGTAEVNVTAIGSVYSLIANYEPGSSIIINNGTYILDAAIDSHVYSGGSAGVNEGVTINGGLFKLGNVGTGSNGKPWIFNVLGANDGYINVNAGTFNADVNHQHWAYEVNVPNTLALKDNGNGTWTVVPAVAQGTDSWRGYNRLLGYASIADAAYWATAETTVTVVADHAITETAIVESNITLDFAGEEVTCSANPAIRIQGNVNVTVKNGNMNTEGYNFILGASDGSSAGNLTIESGTFHGATTVASVTKGLLTITGGDFSVEPYQGNNYAYLINCIDSYYNSGDAKVSISGGTFHNWNPQNNAAEGANTNFCADGYGAVETSTNVWVVMPVQKMALHTGWNWFSSYIETDLESVQNALGSSANQIKSQTGFTQYAGSGVWVDNGEFGEFETEQMYMINTNNSHEMTLVGDLVDLLQTPITIHPNWTWIGYPMNVETNILEAVVDFTPEVGDQIKGRSGFAYYFGEETGWIGDINTLVPGQGYMYHSIAEGEKILTYSYPQAGSRSALKSNVTSENNHWVADAYQYANNMTMLATVDVEGGDYEVAAFVNGEVRGSSRPIYVESLDTYMLFLTIHGDEVEEMTFKMYDLTTGEEYAFDNRITYSDNAIVGSIEEPYMLTCATLGIGESTMSEINIYPNPTTIGREINLEATCEMVEVFNALGVKVAEYQNVDTIDAFETAGIYVIRLTNNGYVKHCRLVVK